jgi:hypothetical protein
MSRVVKAPVFRPSAVAMAVKSGDEEPGLRRWRTMLGDEDENEISNLDPTALDQVAERERMRQEAIEHARQLGEHYNSFVSMALAEKLVGVKVLDGQRVEVSLRDGGKLTDEGPRIRLGVGTDSEIGAMLDLARAKKWDSLSIRGNDQFVWRATIAALQDGRVPADKIRAGKPEQEHVVADAKRRFAEGQKLKQKDEAVAKLDEVIKPRELPSMRKWRDGGTTPASKPAPKKAVA